MSSSASEPEQCSAAELRTLFLFESLSDEQLAMLCRSGRIEVFDTGPVFTEGDPADYVYVLLDGELISSNLSAGRDVVLTRTSQPGVFCGGRGAFNRSRHEKHYLSVRVTRASRFFVIGAEEFGEFVHSQFPMAVHLINGLAEGAEKQTRMVDEHERLLALGQLSAALTHELNNPAAAVARAADELRGHLDAVTSPLLQNRFTDAALSFLSAAQGDLVDRVAAAAGRTLPAMEAADREDEIAQWLSGRGVADAWDLAATFVDAGIDADRLDRLCAGVGQPDWLPGALVWLHKRIEAELLTHQVSEATQRISGLVADVKRYTHLDSGPSQVADVNALLQSTLRMFAGRIDTGTHIEVVMELDPLIPEMLCRPAELNQVWTHIIDNAIAAMGQDRDTPGVLTVRTWKDDNCVHVEIGDTGTGIAEEHRGRVFEPFFTTKPLGEGTGLGLHLAWRIVVHRHNGHLRVSSQPRDTRFQVTLPLPE